MGNEEFQIDEGMFELFCGELESQIQTLNDATLKLEHGECSSQDLQALMRAAHSLKGSARVIGIKPIEQLAHALEDFFVNVQKGDLSPESSQIDLIFKSIDVIARIKEMNVDILIDWLKKEEEDVNALTKKVNALSTSVKPQDKETEQLRQPAEEITPPPIKKTVRAIHEKKVEKKNILEAPQVQKDRVLRVTAQNLSRLMGLAGESMVESRWLQPFGEHLIQLKKGQSTLSSEIDVLRHSLKENRQDINVEKELEDIYERSTKTLNALSERLTELELFISRHQSLTDRLYREVIDSRMRPFSDGVSGFPRMVRDLAKQLGKQARLEINGLGTPVDRDILDKLEAPLTHLLRNSVDHGIEPPDERVAAGKSPEGVIKLTAEHRGGMLAIDVSDDGRGVNIESLRKKVVESNLAKGELARGLNKQELLEFLFLPGFSTSGIVSEISGRGMGLNVVQDFLQEVSGNLQVKEEYGKGIGFHMSLPLTLSVIHAMAVSIGGEPYAFPLARVDRALLVPVEHIEQIENRQYINFEGNNIGLIPAAEVLEVGKSEMDYKILPIVVIRDRENTYGLVVDSFMGEKELVLQDLEFRLGKIPNISAGAFMEDGSPILIIDVDDIISSIDSMLHGGRFYHITEGEETIVSTEKKRILVVDDSITVREVESRLLRNQGYEVETAVNGMDAWNAVRMGSYDLVITDIDMPRMNGIELVKLIKSDAKLKKVPVMIVSYKEREQDRVLGLEAGADYYMTKSSFHDETLLEAVRDLI